MDTRRPGGGSTGEIAADGRGAATLSLSDLYRGARRKTLHMRLTVAGETVLTLVVVGVAISVLQRLPAPLTAAWSGFVSVISVLALYGGIRARRGAWGPVRADLAGLLRLSLNRARAGLRLVSLIHRVILACFAFLIVWGYFDVSSVLQDSDALRERTLAYVSAVLYGGILMLGAHLYGNRKRAELDALEAVYGEIVRDERARARFASKDASESDVAGDAYTGTNP